MECEAEHSLSEHTFHLHSLCRLCGERVKRKVKDKFETPKLSAKYVIDILSCFEVDVQEDSENKHPRSVCQKCYRRLINRKTRPNLDSQAAEKLPRLHTERLSSGLTITPVPRSLNAPCALIFTAQAKAADHKK